MGSQPELEPEPWAYHLLGLISPLIVISGNLLAVNEPIYAAMGVIFIWVIGPILDVIMGESNTRPVPTASTASLHVGAQNENLNLQVRQWQPALRRTEGISITMDSLAHELPFGPREVRFGFRNNSDHQHFSSHDAQILMGRGNLSLLWGFRISRGTDLYRPGTDIAPKIQAQHRATWWTTERVTAHQEFGH